MFTTTKSHFFLIVLPFMSRTKSIKTHIRLKKTNPIIIALKEERHRKKAAQNDPQVRPAQYPDPASKRESCRNGADSGDQNHPRTTE